MLPGPVSAVRGDRLEPSPAPYVRVWPAAVGLFLVLQAFAPSPAKPSAASSQAGLWALSQQSEHPSQVLHFLAVNQDVSQAHLLPPVSRVLLPSHACFG